MEIGVFAIEQDTDNGLRGTCIVDDLTLVGFGNDLGT